MSSSAGLLPRFVQRYLKSGMRGSTRFTFALAKRFKTLQGVPIEINGQRLWIDLRDGLSHLLLAGSPWPGVPWEVNEQLVMRRLVRPGDVVLDVGAHIGLHTVLLSALAGPHGAVHAFEPNADKAAALSITVASLPNARLHRVGLADSSGQARLFVPEDQTMASLQNWTDGRVGAVRVSTCELARLDDLVAARTVPPADFIKCDVEGSELRFFAGATHTLNTSAAPIILYEANVLSTRAFSIDVSAATDMLRSFECARYTIFHIQGGGHLHAIDTFDPGCEHFNLVAMPASKLDRLADNSFPIGSTC